jgi:hypothetical protein
MYHTENKLKNAPRTRSVTLKLSEDEYEWLRRKAHWEETSRAELLRESLLSLIRHEGYLRPPDDEPQDFGFEKEQMQFIVGLQNDSQ